MMKKIFRISLVLLALIFGIAAWVLFTPATAFSDKSVYVIVQPTQNVKETLMKEMEKQQALKSPSVFNFLASTINIWPRIKPGRFKIEKNETLFSILKKFRGNKQEQSKLVINKLRVPGDLAKIIGKNFSMDSTQAIGFLQNNDSLKQFGVDTTTFMELVIPDTYFFYWNATMPQIITKLKKAHDQFWQKNNRTEKAAALGLTPNEVYILASIVEEETRNNAEKDTIASVYINRLQTNMPLGADPTIKYALKDFGLKRILLKHLTIESPFNTYKNKGLPPGPVCTPSIETLDATLNAPKTDYFYFVAKSDFTEAHHFSKTYAEHLYFANQYQQALDAAMKKKDSPNP